MTTGRALARNALFNLGSQIAPLIVAVVAIPILIRALGPTAFGLLTLVSTAIGYFGLFDFGIGRALTHAIATRVGRNETDELSAVTWTGLALLGAFGVVGGAVLAIGTPALIARVLNVDAADQPAARTAFYIMAGAIPLTLIATGFRGILEAYQDFGIASALRTPLAMASYLAPLAVLPFSHDIVAVVAALAAVRVVGAIVHAAVCVGRYPLLRRPHFDRRLVRPLLAYGGWLTVSNVVSPIMTYLDRFMIGAILPLAAVTYYVTPFEVVSRLFIIPAAILGVLFPAFAATFAVDRNRTRQLVDRAFRVIILVMFPAAFLLATLGQEILTIWISAAFARESTLILQWLAIGVLINSAGQVAFTVLQGVGRPDLTAKTHLIELPLYLASIWGLSHAFGLVGVAMAWTFRVSADTVAMMALMARPAEVSRALLLRVSALLASAVAVTAACSLLTTTQWRLVAVAVVAVAFSCGAWWFGMDLSERDLVRGWLARRRGLIASATGAIAPSDPAAPTDAEST